MSEYLRYDANGTITGGGDTSPEMLHLERHPAGTQVMWIASPRSYWNTHYVVGSALVPLQVMAPTKAGTTLSGLPMPCTVKTNNQTFTVTDGVAELDYSFVGTYTVEVTALHYLPYTTTVTK